MYADRLILHHLDPTRAEREGGGIETCIRGMIRFARDTTFAVAGLMVRPRGEPIGLWAERTVSHGGRDVPSLHLGHSSRGPGDVPNAVRLVAGAVRHRRALRRVEPAIVQVHRVEVVPIARRLFPGAQLDLFLHEDARRWTPTTSSSKWRRTPGLHHRLIDYAVAAADRVLCFSPSASDYHRRRHGHVIPMPTWFDPETFYATPLAPAASTKLLWVGRLDPVKDPLLALDVLQALPVDHTLTVVGDGALRATITGEVEARQLQQRVTLAGAVPMSEVASLMQQHHVLLMTSHSEGFPRVLVESLASGRPVVATEGADTGHLLTRGKTGGRASTRDPAELAALVVAARDCDPDDCRAAVEELAAPNVIQRILTA